MLRLNDLIAVCVNQLYWYIVIHPCLHLCLDNVALHKPAHQEFPYENFESKYTEASNAVDGLKSNLSWQGGQCVISENYKQTATWWVNLTSILSIHHVTIYYRTGNAPWGE